MNLEKSKSESKEKLILRFSFLFGYLIFMFISGDAWGKTNDFSAQEKIIWEILGYLNVSDNLKANTSLKNSDGTNYIFEAEYEDLTVVWPSKIDLKLFKEDKLITSFIKELPLKNKIDEFEFKNLLNFLELLKDDNPILINDFSWQQEALGLWYAQSTVNYGVRLGNPDIHLLKFDPLYYNLVPHNETLLAKSVAKNGQINLIDWLTLLPNSKIVFTSGMYYPDRSYMGIFKKGKVFLSKKEHALWKGYIVSKVYKKPKNRFASVKLLDTKKEIFDYEKSDYDYILQTYILLDSDGQIRVKNNAKLASRIAIGQGKEGMIIIAIIPNGAVSLYDFSLLLKKSSLNLNLILGLDGGLEAQLARFKKDKIITLTGTWTFSQRFGKAVYVPIYSPTLPSIIAVEEIN